MLGKALFLDRDGVINQEVSYLNSPENLLWMEGIFELCRMAKGLGYKLVVVTNQAGIGRRLYTEMQFDALMQWMGRELEKEGAALDAVYFCPYHPEYGVGEYKREHEDRKPRPGMLLRAAKDLELDLAQSVMVGDRCSDIGAAHAAGLRRAFLLRGTETGTCAGEYAAVNSLAEVGEWLALEAAGRSADGQSGGAC